MQLKIPPVIVFFVSLALLFSSHYFFAQWSYHFPYQVTLSRGMLVAGALVAFSGMLSFRLKGTTISPMNPHKTSQLVRSGVYQYTRNPMYLGMALLLIGGVVRIGNPLGLFGMIIFVWYIDYFQIRPEEKILEKLFGDEYQKYCEDVRRWI